MLDHVDFTDPTQQRELSIDDPTQQRELSIDDTISGRDLSALNDPDHLERSRSP